MPGPSPEQFAAELGGGRAAFAVPDGVAADRRGLRLGARARAHVRRATRSAWPSAERARAATSRPARRCGCGMPAASRARIAGARLPRAALGAARGRRRTRRRSSTSCRPALTFPPEATRAINANYLGRRLARRASTRSPAGTTCAGCRADAHRDRRARRAAARRPRRSPADLARGGVDVTYVKRARGAPRIPERGRRSLGRAHARPISACSRIDTLRLVGYIHKRKLLLFNELTRRQGSIDVDERTSRRAPRPA